MKIYYYKIIVFVLIGIIIFILGYKSKKCPEINTLIWLENYDSLKTIYNDSICKYANLIDEKNQEIVSIKESKKTDSIKLQKKLIKYYEKVAYYNSISNDSNFLILSEKYKLDTDKH